MTDLPRVKKAGVKSVPSIDEPLEDFIITTRDQAAREPQPEQKEISVDELAEKWLTQAMRTYDYEKKQSSAFLNEYGSYNAPTLDEIWQLAEGAQDSLSKILRINSIISKYANVDDVVGMVVNAISTNINDEFRLAYKNVDGRNKSKKAERAKELINNFNEEVGIKRIIRETIPRVYTEGTVIMYLRKDTDTWTVDTYPLGVAMISPYKVGGDPVVLIDIEQLKSRLQKVAPVSRTGESLFYKNLDQEIQVNFPKEIYDSFKKRDPLAKLDIRYSGVVRVGNMGRKYGLSPIMRALPSSIVLETFLKSDMLNAKARAKKMIVALLDPKLLGDDGQKNPLTQQAFSHAELVEAYKRQNPLFTAPAYVRDVKTVEFQGEMVNKDTIYFYLHKQMSTLGIGFNALDSGAGAVTSANISLAQLMRTINSISSEIEDVIEKFYRRILEDEGLPPEYAPSIQIIDSEALEFELKSKLVDLLYSKMNCSLQTALEILGINFQEEINRRQAEEDMKLYDVFKPRQTSYTSGGNSDNPTGRPKGKETDKQVYDENYNETRT